MRSARLAALVALLIAVPSALAFDSFRLPNPNADGWLRLRDEGSAAAALAEGEYLETPSYPDIKSAVFRQPLDHFDGTTNLTFEQRYWYSLRHYKPPADNKTVTPVYVLDSGETNAEGRLPYLDHGILDILASQTGGIGVVLEHRYYGKSYPPREAFDEPGQSWGVDELRWLNNRQALEDSNNFARNVRFDGVDEPMTAKDVPYIAYGGSYPGARAALLRTLFPDVWFGAFASSAVIAAIESFPQYFDPVARGINVTASQAIQVAVASMDAILAPEPWLGGMQPKRDANKTAALLELAGLKGLTKPVDFAQLVTYPLGEYQSVNWDETVAPSDFATFLARMVHTPEATLAPLRAKAADLKLDLPDEALRLISYLRRTIIDPCVTKGHSADECFGSGDWKGWIENPKLTSSKAWLFQVCTQWGYFQSAPPSYAPTSPGVFHATGPKMISSLIDDAYSSEVCREGYPAGKHFTIPSRPDINDVNRHGNFSLGADVDRLGYLDGLFDPWRPATAHSSEFATPRPHTLDRPFILIPNATHHWDENGWNKDQGGPKPPAQIEAVHAEMVKAAKHWLSQWEAKKQ